MADNYLEKKLEEHLNAPYKQPKKRVPTHERKAIVTGGAKGIGAAIVKALRVAGHKVSFCDINDEAGRETALRTGADFYHCDVSDPESLAQYMQTMADKWGGIDIIVNNAGISEFANICDVDVATFDKIVNTNMRPAFITGQFMAKLRRAQPATSSYGRIINICSTRQRQSESGTEAYAASKGGLFSLTHALAMSLSPYHITVNSISPGWIEVNDYEALSNADHEQHPSRRVGRPEDIARMIRFLIEDNNDFVNGENIVVDGGMTRKMQYCE